MSSCSNCTNAVEVNIDFVVSAATIAGASDVGRNGLLESAAAIPTIAGLDSIIFRCLAAAVRHAWCTSVAKSSVYSSERFVSRP